MHTCYLKRSRSVDGKGLMGKGWWEKVDGKRLDIHFVLFGFIEIQKGRMATQLDSKRKNGNKTRFKEEEW